MYFKYRAADIARMAAQKTFNVVSINSGAAIGAVLPTDRSSAAQEVMRHNSANWRPAQKSPYGWALHRS